MTLANTRYRYGWASRVMHWTSVVLVVTLFIGISGLDVPPKNADRAAIVDFHASIGLVLLALMSARALWRWRNPNPLHSYRLAPWHAALALAIHRSLYVVVMGQCLLGIVGFVAGGAALPLFDIATIPTGLPPQPQLRELALAVHDGLSNALLLLIGVHASAAVFNQVFGVADQPDPPE